MTRRKVSRRLLTVGFAALLGGPLVAAAPVTAEPTTAPAAPDQVPAVTAAGEPALVTLVTGDQMSVQKLSDGTYRTSVNTPAARPDGTAVTFLTRSEPDGDVYVYPSDAMPGIQQGRLDKELFNARYLVENGYTDTAEKTLPVIVRYDQRGVARAPAGALAAQADALPGTSRVRALESIGAAGAEVAKTDLPSFWATVADPAAPARPAHVWLDRRYRALDETAGTGDVGTQDVQSNEQIGVPVARAEGLDGAGMRVAVLDTGIDATHPDLAGKIVASQNFADPGQPVTDRVGHGTHVASTIVGTGAASDGRYEGVAPAAQLVIGKVLGDDGFGTEAQIIDGMEWATTQGTRVINMSLGGCCTNGTDPMSLALNRITAETGVLFVVAAGNDDAGRGRISSPGSADAALTVAAVDANDRRAQFSSTGPRLDDWGVKPDIAAPGVDIPAARATGTSVPPNECSRGDIDQWYTRMCGTSMATPHVAGAAVLLAQKYPGWHAGDLKSALMSTVDPLDHTVYEVGAGRLDVGQAATSQVFAVTPNVDFTFLRFPHDQPVTRELSYVNRGTTPLALTLSTTLHTTDGTPAPDGLLTLSTNQLTVPAGDTVTVTVTLDRALGENTTHTGAIHAATGNTELTTPVGFFIAPEMFLLRVDLHDRDGTVPDDPNWCTICEEVVATQLDGQLESTSLVKVGAGRYEALLPRGRYFVNAAVTWRDDGDNYGLLTEPELDLSADSSLILSAEELEKVEVRTPRATEQAGIQYRLTRGTSQPGRSLAVDIAISSRLTSQWVWVQPTDDSPVTFGTGLAINLIEPNVAMRIAGDSPVTLSARYAQWGATSNPMLSGQGRLPLVDAGLGRAEDFARVDARGKLALVEVPPTDSILLLSQVQNALDAGVVGILAFSSHSFIRPTPTSWNDPLAKVSVTPAEGALLRDRLGAGPVSIDYTGTPFPSYQYNLVFEDTGPAGIRYEVAHRYLATVDTYYHSPPSDVPFFRTQWTYFSASGAQYHLAQADVRPGKVTHYYSPLSDGVLRRMVVAHPAAGRLFGHSKSSYERFDRPGRQVRHWGQAPFVPGVVTPGPDELATNPGAPYSRVFRQGDRFWLRMGFVDSDPRNGASQFVTPLSPWNTDVHLYRGGQELPLQMRGFYPTFEMPAGPGDYRLTASTPEPGIPLVSRADTTWRFGSQRPAINSLPEGTECYGRLVGDSDEPCAETSLLFLRYDLGLDVDNAATGPGAHWYTITAYHNDTPGAAPRVTQLRAETSIDGERTWYRAIALPMGNGQYRVLVLHPPTQRTSGAVSLRIHAQDTAGNTIDQTVHDAYTLKDRGHR